MERAVGAVVCFVVLVIKVSAESLGYERCWAGHDVATSGLPWHASIFVQLEELPGAFQYVCAGVLVTDRHLLTDKEGLGSDRAPSRLFVALGAATASWDPDAPGVVISKVSRVLVTDNSFNYIQAVVELEVPLALTESVQPICVDSDTQPQPGDAGFMVVPDPTKNLTLKLQKLKYASQDGCEGESRYTYLQEHHFCVDSSDEPVCPEARGSGLVFRAGGRWLLVGVLGANSLQDDRGDGRCVAGRQVFSDVGFYVPQLRDLLLSSCFSGRPTTAPWHGQLYLRKEPRGLEYACTAVLITHRYLLTDGSCIKDRIADNSTDASGFVVALGKKVKSLETRETGTQILEVSRVELEDGEQGLAVVELATPAALGDSVAAVCLDTGRQQAPAAGAPGVVATFNPPENSPLKLLYVNIADSDKCSVETPELKPFLSAAKFCAADRKAGVCPGNEGAALLTRAPERGGSWTLRGVLAAWPRPASGGDACPRGNALFTSVDHSLRWVLATLYRLSVPRSLVKPEGVEGCWSGHAGNIPWHVLIYRQLQRREWFDLECAGTIISRRHVVTDAACLWNETSGTVRDLSKLRVTAGKKIRDWNAREAGVQIRQVSQALVQPGYQREAGSGPAVAVAVLEKPLELGGAVRSVCVDGGPPSGGQTGLVPSLGLPRSAELQILNMNVLQRNECLAELPANSCWTVAPDKFCAIDRKVPEGLCSGSVGAGLVSRGPGGAWLLRGVAASRQLRRGQRGCSKAAVFFTAVGDSLQWVFSILRGGTAHHLV